MAFLPQNCSNFYLVQPGIKQNLLKLHPPRRFSQKRKMAKVVALYITSKVTGSSTSPYAMQNFISQIGQTETFAVKMAIHPLQASF